MASLESGEQFGVARAHAADLPPHVQVQPFSVSDDATLIRIIDRVLMFHHTADKAATHVDCGAVAGRRGWTI